MNRALDLQAADTEAEVSTYHYFVGDLEKAPEEFPFLRGITGISFPLVLKEIKHAKPSGSLPPRIYRS
jgi:hypothetical protein